MSSKLSKHIMRRIWYGYYIRQVETLVTARAFWQGIVFGGAFGVFTDVVHVASVIDNTLSTPLGQLPTYITKTVVIALQNGEVISVVTLVLLVGIALSILRKVVPYTFFNFIPRHA
jgi:Na+/H+-dicarboxylate symporter